MADHSVSVPMTLKGRTYSRGQIFFRRISLRTLVRPRTTKFGRITREGVFLGGQLRPYRKGVPFYLCIHPLMQNCQFWRGNTYGEGACFRWLATPPPKWGGSQRSPILGFITMYLHPLPQNYQIWRGNTWGRYVLGSPRLPPKESRFSALPCSFWGFSCTGCGKIK